MMIKANIVHVKDIILFQGQARALMVPGVVGEFEVGELHAPIASLMKKGSIIIDSGHMGNGGIENTFINKQAVQTTYDATGRLFWVIKIQQGLMRYDGSDFVAVVEKGIISL